MPLCRTISSEWNVVAPLADDLAIQFIARIQCHGAIGAYIFPCALLKLRVGLRVKRSMVGIPLVARELGELPFRETERSGLFGSSGATRLHRSSLKRALPRIETRRADKRTKTRSDAIFTPSFAGQFISEFEDPLRPAEKSTAEVIVTWLSCGGEVDLRTKRQVAKVRRLHRPTQLSE